MWRWCGTGGRGAEEGGVEREGGIMEPRGGSGEERGVGFGGSRGVRLSERDSARADRVLGRDLGGDGESEGGSARVREVDEKWRVEIGWERSFRRQDEQIGLVDESRRIICVFMFNEWCLAWI